MTKLTKLVIVIILLISGFSIINSNTIDYFLSIFFNNYKNISKSTVFFDDKLHINKISEKVILKRIIDGDTVIVNSSKGDETIRLLLVDTPETVHPSKSEQPYAQEATKFVKLALNESKTIWIERGEPDFDFYNRTLAYLWYERKNGDIINLNIELVLEGLGRLSIFDENNVKYLSKYKKALRFAKYNKLNIWSIDKYVSDSGFNTTILD